MSLADPKTPMDLWSRITAKVDLATYSEGVMHDAGQPQGARDMALTTYSRALEVIHQDLRALMLQGALDDVPGLLRLLYEEG